jgi:3-deoxy-manno-octulosonate cytidylyltransferase (CMP-KDO synthetase)
MPEICRHLGVYGFKRSALARWAEVSDSAVASHAGLEQLGALAAGWRVGAVHVDRPAGPAVDISADLEAVRAILKSPTVA